MNKKVLSGINIMMDTLRRKLKMFWFYLTVATIVYGIALLGREKAILRGESMNKKESLLEIYTDSSHKGYGVYVAQLNWGIKGTYNAKVTTNVGEFLAMLKALDVASHVREEYEKTVIYSDSQLVVNHLTKHWKINSKNKDLQSISKETKIRYMLMQGRGVVVKKISREFNTLADALSQGKDIEIKKN